LYGSRKSSVRLGEVLGELPTKASGDPTKITNRLAKGNERNSMKLLLNAFTVAEDVQT